MLGRFLQTITAPEDYLAAIATLPLHPEQLPVQLPVQPFPHPPEQLLAHPDPQPEQAPGHPDPHPEQPVGHPDPQLGDLQRLDILRIGQRQILLPYLRDEVPTSPGGTMIKISEIPACIRMARG